jgi:hypothetical protein
VIDIDRLRDVNNSTIDKLSAVVNAINNLLADPNLSLDDEGRLIARRATLNAQIDTQSLIRAHLKAAQVVVDFCADEALRLEQMSARMDGYILSGLRVDAMLALVPEIVDTAISIGNAITSHTGQSAVGASVHGAIG